MKVAFWLLVGLNLILLGAMYRITLPALVVGGTQLPFDLQRDGYDLVFASKYLCGLGQQRIDYYRFPQHAIDTACPILTSLTAFIAVAWLTRDLGRWRWLLAALTIPCGVLDLLENYAVGVLLDAGPTGLTESLVASASQWTILKFWAYYGAGAVLAALLLRWSWQKWRPQRSPA